MKHHPYITDSFASSIPGYIESRGVDLSGDRDARMLGIGTGMLACS